MKTVATKVSACVDCATSIIGDRLRCPACHDRHADEFLASMSDDDDMTIPRDRVTAPLSIWQGLAAWLVVVLIIAAVVVLMLAGRGRQ